MTTLIPGVGAGRRLETDLLALDRVVRIGAVQHLDFTRAVVLTHDFWKHEAGGIPQFCLLLAAARDVNSVGEDDDEVLLLRVEGTAPLALETDLHAVREESLREALSSATDPSPAAVLDVPLDPFTKNRVSYTGLDCRILGTFYEDRRDGEVVLEWGADVDNFYATSTYQVFKPRGDGLSAIASYLKPTPGDPVTRVRIGAVRYASTRRRAIAANQADAAVLVNVHDFIGHKTGMFGMTRMGKSNTMKTVIARTFAVSERGRRAGGRPVGQLVLDPQGEYANPNTQDGTEIAAIGADHVRIYRFGVDGAQPHVRPLGFNFFDPNQVGAVQEVIASALADSNADYVRAFLRADFTGDAGVGVPEDERYRREAHATRGRLLLYASLTRAEYQIPEKDPTGQRPWRSWVKMAKPLADAIEADLGDGRLRRPESQRGWVGVEPTHLTEVVDWIVAKSEEATAKASEETASPLPKPLVEALTSFVDGDAWRSALPIYTQVNQGRPVSGYTKLKPLQDFHAPSSSTDYRDEIHDELVAGRVVIVDLHLGPDKVTRRLSEDLAARLIEKQTAVFTRGEEPPRIQMIIEEAHNLFTAKRYQDDLDVWVRLAKEASKLRIGLIYATQEVTGVAPQVLANTKNWVVAHLNNRREVAELSKYYDFGVFADAIIASEDKGYVRLKTMSSPFVVPVQIDRYGPALVDEARAAAGDPPLPRSSR